MRFSCGETYDGEKKRLSDWHDFFTLWPRSVAIIGTKTVCVWLETIERRGDYYEGNYAGGEGWLWEYRLKS